MSREADQKALAEARKREESGQVEGIDLRDKGTTMQGYREVRGLEGKFDGSRDAGKSAGERDSQGRII